METADLQCLETALGRNVRSGEECKEWGRGV